MDTDLDEVVPAAEIIEETELSVIFTPTDLMQKLLDVALREDSGVSIEDWGKVARIDKQHITKWFQNQDFVSWICREFEKRLDGYKLVWLKVGLTKMQFDFKYWSELGKIFYPDGVKFSKESKEDRGVLEQEILAIYSQKKIDLGEPRNHHKKVPGRPAK